MKPLLASLVLLLLALCRSSAHLTFKVVSINTESSKAESSISASPSAMAEVVKSTVKKPVTPEQTIELIDSIGNFMFFMTLGTKLHRVPYLRNSLKNGLMCDVEDKNTDFKEKLNKAMSAIMSREDEEKSAKEDTDPNKKLDCAATVPNDAPKRAKEFFKCFCEDKNSLFFCFIKSMSDITLTDGEKLTKKTCRKEALDALKAAGTGALGKDYDADGFEKRNFANEFGGKDVGAVTKNEDAEMAKIYCDALNSDVENAVKDLYAADGLYWMAESTLYSIIFGAPTKPVPETCNEAQYQTNEYGKCVCKLDTGYTFCIYKVLGQFFKDAGYLDCTPKTFVKEKKPDALPQLVKAGGGGGGRSQTSSATASSLMMVPLMAAAVLLARH